MGCANSNLLPIRGHENGEFVAPPYELKQASDKLTTEGQGLLGTARRMFSTDNVTSKLKDTAGDIVDSTPVQSVLGGAVQAKDVALSKIQGAGDAVKHTIGSFTHQTEEKFGTLAHDAEEKVGDVLNDAESAVTDAMKSVEDKIKDIMPTSEPVEEETIIPEHVDDPEPEIDLEKLADTEVPAEVINQENGEVDEVLVVETTEPEVEKEEENEKKLEENDVTEEKDTILIVSD